MKNLRKFLYFLVIVGMVLSPFAMVTPAYAHQSEGEGPPPVENMHCPSGGTKFDTGSGTETIDGVTVSWSDSTVNVEGGSAVICVKASTQSSGVIIVNDTWSVNWVNEGGQTPDISYLVVYETTKPTPEPEIDYEIHTLAVCDKEPDEVEIRVQNLSDVSLIVKGELYAQPYGGETKLISAVPPQYQEVTPGNWGGPEERLRNHYDFFDGVVWGWVEIYTLEGTLLERYEMPKQEPDGNPCGEQPTPTKTATPSPTPTDTPAPSPTPSEEPEWPTDHLGSCERLNASMQNDSSGSVMAKGTMWDKDGNVLGQNSHQINPGDWFNVGVNTPKNYIGEFSWSIVFTDVDSGEKLAKFEGSDTVDCGEKPTPSPTPTDTPEPTPSPTPTEPPKECITTDIKGRLFYEGNHMSGNPVKGEVTNLSDDPECQDELYLLVFGSNQAPETDGWLESQVHTESFKISVPPGTTDKPFSREIDTSEFCWYQVDLLRTNEVRHPPTYVVPDMVDYVFVEGTKPSCDEEEDKKPPKPVCPTCGPHIDEFVESGVLFAMTSETQCVITWDEEEQQWCDNLTPYAYVLSDGVPISILDHSTWEFTPVSKTDEGDYYLAEGEDLPDQTGKGFSIWHGTLEGPWDPAKDAAGEYVRIRDAIGPDKVEVFYPCGRTPGTWDVQDGEFEWKVGHNKSEVTQWAMEEFDLSYEEAYDWARQLSEAGVGSSLPLPSSP